MLQGEILVWKCLGPIDRGTACAIAVEEVAPLDHEIFDLREVREMKGHTNNRSKIRKTYHSMELAAFVSLRPSLSVFGLTRAELAEILCGAWCDVCEQLHLDSAQRLP